jgi:hypothetical protein
LADTSRFASLIDVYATMATSDDVVHQLLQHGLVDAKDLKNGVLPIDAEPAKSTVNMSTPMMTLTASATSPEKATDLTVGATNAFLDVLHARQREAKIPDKDRIDVRVVKQSDEPKLVRPRSKAMTMLVFLGGLIATAAVAFTRENLARRGAASAPQLRPAETLDEPVERESALALTRDNGARRDATVEPLAAEPVDEPAEPEPLVVSRGRWAPSLERRRGHG